MAEKNSLDQLFRDENRTLEIVEKVNQVIEGGLVYITVLNLEYVLTGCEIYSDIDPNDQTFYLILIFIQFTGEKASRECDVMIQPEELYQLVVKSVEENGL